MFTPKTLGSSVSKLCKLDRFATIPSKLKQFESIPGPKALPWIGNIWRYMPIIGQYDINDHYKNALLNRAKFGPIVREKITDNLTILHLFDPDDIEALYRQDDKFPNRRSFLAMLKYRLDRPDRYLDGGIVPENGPRWHRQRSQFQQRMLSKSKVSSYANKIDEATLRTIKELEIDKMASEKHMKVKDFQNVFSRWSLRCIASLFLDCDIDTMKKEEVNRLLEEIDNTLIATHATELISTKWMKNPDKCKYYQMLVKSQDFLHDFAAGQIDRLIKTHSPDWSGGAMVHDWLYCDKIDHRDVVSFVMDAFLGGIHTTGYTLAHLFYYIARHPEYQKQLHSEIDTSHIPKHGLLNANHVENLSFLRVCLAETLRMNPISIGTGRLTTSDIQIRGYSIPKGTMIIAHNQLIGRDRNVFKNADSFEPLRWEQYRSCPRHTRPSPFAFRPFGLGARACIGQRVIELEMKILAARFLQRFELIDTTEIKTKTGVVHILDGNFGVTLRRRY